MYVRTVYTWGSQMLVAKIAIHNALRRSFSAFGGNLLAAHGGGARVFWAGRSRLCGEKLRALPPNHRRRRRDGRGARGGGDSTVERGAQLRRRRRPLFGCHLARGGARRRRAHRRMVGQSSVVDVLAPDSRRE